MCVRVDNAFTSRFKTFLPCAFTNCGLRTSEKWSEQSAWTVSSLRLSSGASISAPYTEHRLIGPWTHSLHWRLARCSPGTPRSPVSATPHVRILSATWSFGCAINLALQVKSCPSCCCCDVFSPQFSLFLIRVPSSPPGLSDFLLLYKQTHMLWRRSLKVSRGIVFRALKLQILEWHILGFYICYFWVWVPNCHLSTDINKPSESRHILLVLMKYHN